MVAFEALEASALICVFEDAVIQLNILSTLEGDKGKTGAAARPVSDETDLGLSDRVRRQRARLKSTFERLIGRLVVSGDVGSLLRDDLRRSSEVIGDDDIEDSDDLEDEDAAETRRSLRETEREIAQAKATLAEQDTIIARLKEEERVEASVSLAKRRIAENWARARLQLLQRTHCLRDDSTRRRAEDTRIDRRSEIRVHTELIKFLNLAIEDLQKQTKSWKEQYKTQTAHWDATLKRLRTDKDQHADRLRSVSDELARRTEFCLEVLRIREQRRAAAEIRQREHNAATRIQAWWRGHMVRRGFGSFRKRQKVKHPKQRSPK